MRYQVRDPDAMRELIEKTPVRAVPHSERSLADQVGVSKSLIGYLKHGGRDTFAEDFARGIAEVYGRSLDELFVSVESTSIDDQNEPGGDGS